MIAGSSVTRLFHRRSAGHRIFPTCSASRRRWSARRTRGGNKLEGRTLATDCGLEPLPRVVAMQTLRALVENPQIVRRELQELAQALLERDRAAVDGAFPHELVDARRHLAVELGDLARRTEPDHRFDLRRRRHGDGRDRLA